MVPAGALGRPYDGNDPLSFRNIRERALRTADPPAWGGDEVTYLDTYITYIG